MLTFRTAQVHGTEAADVIARLASDGLGGASVNDREAAHDQARPDFPSIHCGAGFYAAAPRAAAIAVFGPGARHGGASCLGVMGADGLHLDGAGAAAFAIWDRE